MQKRKKNTCDRHVITSKMSPNEQKKNPVIFLRKNNCSYILQMLLEKFFGFDELKKKLSNYFECNKRKENNFNQKKKK